MFGKLFHLGMDALIISAFLAGVRRSTGLTYVSMPLTAANEALTLTAVDPHYLKFQTKTFVVSPSW
jgi:hypothetical protein